MALQSFADLSFSYSSLFYFKFVWKDILTLKNGPPSATITSKALVAAAFLKNSSTNFDLPIVIIISFECICSDACCVMFSELNTLNLFKK